MAIEYPLIDVGVFGYFFPHLKWITNLKLLAHKPLAGKIFGVCMSKKYHVESLDLSQFVKESSK